MIKVNCLRLPKVTMGVVRTKTVREGLEMMAQMQEAGCHVVGGRLAQILLRLRNDR